MKANKGAPGIDGMTFENLTPHLKEHWPTIRAQLLDGSYKPQPVRRVEIPKASGGKRPLGIPTVLDRFIQQAVMQVLQADWDRTFSEASFGFRPERSAHQAVELAQAYIASGYDVVVDTDLEKFFDRVNHDILMGLVAKRVMDKRILKLIRGFLTAGVMADGLVSPTEEGTPQGGPLSPLLSNLMLDLLDKELEKRGHRFVRYADDCNIYVRSQRAGERVMASIEQFLAKRLKLKINKAKSAVAEPNVRKFLGFSLAGGKQPRRRIAPQAIDRLKVKVRDPRGARAARASRKSPRNCRATSLGGAPTLASAKLLRCCATSTSGSGDGCVPSPGSNGSTDAHVTNGCAASASVGNWQPILPAAPTALGGSAQVPRSTLLCQTYSSPRRSTSQPWHPNLLSNLYRTAVYGPVRTVVWEGRSREALPYPDRVHWANRKMPSRHRRKSGRPRLHSA